MSEVVYCGQCGQSNPTGNKFCGKCGITLVIMPSLKTPAQPDTLNSCPICKKSDQIRKLSAISSSETRNKSGESYSSGRSNVYDKDSNFIGDSYSSSSSRINITEQSELAKKVACPEIPPKPSAPNNDNPLLETIVTGFLSIVGLGVSVYTGMQFYESSGSFLNMFLGCVLGLILAALIGGLIVLAPIMLLTQPSQEQKITYQEQLKAYEQHLGKWEQSRRKWEQMYYCYRDNVVFLPGKPSTVQPDKTVQFCYQNINE